MVIYVFDQMFFLLHCFHHHPCWKQYRSAREASLCEMIFMYFTASVSADLRLAACVLAEFEMY